MKSNCAHRSTSACDCCSMASCCCSCATLSSALASLATLRPEALLSSSSLDCSDFLWQAVSS